ncbi:MAG: response regulator [Planctomycetaceae bacterium]|nr:response regulator [Planctomycetaceae bacterium]
MRVYACDDQPHMTTLVKASLKRDQHQVETFSDGIYAWDRIRKQPPDLLICDCEMPEMNGLELCRRIREVPELAGLPIIMLTAKSYQLPEERLKKDLQILEILPKPFSPRELRQLVMVVDKATATV